MFKIEYSYFTFNSSDAESCYWRVRHIRRNFIEGLGLNTNTLFAALTAAWEMKGKDDTLDPVPMPAEIDHSRQQDFYELEQWFFRAIPKVKSEKTMKIADAISESKVDVSTQTVSNAARKDEIFWERKGYAKKSPLYVFKSEIIKKWG